MAARRLICGLILCLGMVSAMPARAEDPVVRTQPLKTELFEDIVDGIGGVLGVLVGPPISSPSPHLKTSEWPALETPPAPVQPERAIAPVPVPPAAPPQAVIPVAVPSPAAVTTVAPPVEPPPVPAVKVAAPPAPPAPPRPALPVAAAPPAPPPPAPVAAASSACSVRVAATATLDQMRRLPKCP